MTVKESARWMKEVLCGLEPPAKGPACIRAKLDAAEVVPLTLEVPSGSGMPVVLLETGLGHNEDDNAGVLLAHARGGVFGMFTTIPTVDTYKMYRSENGVGVEGFVNNNASIFPAFEKSL